MIKISSTQSHETMVQQTMNREQRDNVFFQLTGHKDCFKRGPRPDTILKRFTGNESECLGLLMHDPLAPFVPKVYGQVVQDGQLYLEMQDLLSNFKQACVMDVKMGCRTYGEEELGDALREAKLRRDMYEKMVEVDANEPTPDERKIKAISKPRYMIWRESVSSTAKLCFRIEAMRLRDGVVDKEFKTVKEEDQITKSFRRFVASDNIRNKYLKRLYDLKSALMKSRFFWTHEFIGSSLLFVHDDNDAGIWLIDFAKTHKLSGDIEISHKNKWELGNHEDGYLVGVENLIRIFEQISARPLEQDIPHRVKDEMKKHTPQIATVPISNKKVGLNRATKNQRFLPELRT